MAECFDCLGTGETGGLMCPTCCGTGYVEDTDYSRPSSSDNSHPEGCGCSLCDPYEDYDDLEDEEHEEDLDD